MRRPINEKDPALITLLKVYEQRKDLRESFPEASSGNYDRLVCWAAGVARGSWKDSSYAPLQGYKEWYFQASFAPEKEPDPSAAFKTWNRTEESLEAIEKRIHDGVPIERLHERAAHYMAAMSSNFPWAMPEKNAVVLEIGSGVGYIMEAAFEKLHPSRITGLDIAPAMIERAKERLARDKVAIPAEFLSYDGIEIPMESGSVDYVYSVACLQHIPKPYVYNLFGQMMRVLKPSGAATLHFLSFSVLKLRAGAFDIRLEIAQQLAGAEGHWHHFYSRDELMYVLKYGYNAQHVEVTEDDGALWAAFTPS